MLQQQRPSLRDTVSRHSALANNLSLSCRAVLQEESFFAGRVVCEVEGGQLNDTAVMLEGDTGLSEGGRVHLNLSQLPAFRLFPGQVRSRSGSASTAACSALMQLTSAVWRGRAQALGC